MFITYAASFVIGAAVLLVDLLIGAALVTQVISALRLAVHGVTTTGETVWIGEPRPGFARKIRVAYITPQGKFEADGRSPQPRLGEPATVRYHSDQPDLATANTDFWRQVAVGLPALTVSAALSFGMVIGAAWYFAGIQSQARVTLTGCCFVLLLAIVMGYYAGGRYALLLRWRSLVQTEGKVLRYEAPPGNTGGTGRILISFQTADCREKFWAQAGSANVGSEDEVTVYYDPSKPASSATVQSASVTRSYAIFSTVITLGFGALGIYGLCTLL